MTMTNVMRFQIHIGILLALSSTLALADDWQVSDLMQLLGESKAGKALFVEKKIHRNYRQAD
jgi:hypothetical protein